MTLDKVNTSQAGISLLEVLDDRNRPLAAMPPRVVHSQNLRHHRVVVLVYNQEQALFLPRRTAENSEWALCWDVSLSIHLLAGWSLVETARHGLRESLGLTGVKLRFVQQIPAEAETGFELISVFSTGQSNMAPTPDPEMLEQTMFVEAHEVMYLMQSFARHLTPTLRILWEQGLLFT